MVDSPTVECQDPFTTLSEESDNMPYTIMPPKHSLVEKQSYNDEVIVKDCNSNSSNVQDNAFDEENQFVDNIASVIQEVPRKDKQVNVSHMVSANPEYSAKHAKLTPKPTAPLKRVTRSKLPFK